MYNETIKTILNRRSIRNYLPEQIENEELETILNAGINAPSGHNNQPWHFTVIQNRKVVDELNYDAKEVMSNSEDKQLKAMGKNANFNIFYNAPTIIIISGEQKAVVPELDCAAATQNMILAAESLGIGTCWIGLAAYLFRSDKVQKYIDLFKIPENYAPYYAITVGYKAESERNKKPFPRREGTISYFKG